MTILEGIYLATILVICAYIDEDSKISEDDWGTLAKNVEWTYPLLFLILFILLSISVFVLIGKLRSKNYSMSDESVNDHYFRKEICTLTTILVLFSISYLLRVIYDVIVGFTDAYGTYA